MDLIKEIAERQKKFLSGDPEGTKEKAMALSYDDYFLKIEDNLNEEMSECHLGEYRKGSGGEIRPPKMACVYSSSAMAFNMLGNKKVTFKSDSTGKQHFDPGEYSIEYEKKLRILKKSNGMSNIDAFLFDEDGKKAIFCEMKMKEWLASSNEDLKEAYKKKENYCDGASEIFLDLITKFQEEKEQKESPLNGYDVWQMFKHTLAIFNAFAAGGELADKKYKKITLANVVYNIEWPSTNESEFKKEFEKKFNSERAGFKKFHEIIFDPESGLKDLFKKECGVDFDIVFIPTHDFIDRMEKTSEQKKYLERYWKF